jgi:DNL zinc finger.
LSFLVTKAYRHGVVITVCKGCMNKHLIADNLGWMQYVGGFDGNSNIEDFMNDIGRGDEVNRVSQEVFELEKLVHSSADDAGGLSSLDESNNGNSFE